jgi:hypothetical protein
MIKRCRIENGKTHWHWVITPDDWFLWIVTGSTVASFIGLLFLV